MSPQGQIKRIIDRLANSGWRVVKGRHYRIYPPDRMKAPITASRSPSDNYAVNNFIKDIRDAGYTGSI